MSLLEKLRPGKRYQDFNDDLLESDLKTVFRRPEMAVTTESRQRQHVGEFAAALDTLATYDRAIDTVPRTKRQRLPMQRARALVSALALTVTITAGIATLGHNVWGWGDHITVTMPGWQGLVQAFAKHTASSATHPSGHLTQPAPQTAWRILQQAQWFGLTSAGPFGGGAQLVNSVTIATQNFALPGDAAPNNSPASTDSILQFDATSDYQPQASFNNELARGHALRLTLGCTDDSAIGSSSSIRIYTQSSHQPAQLVSRMAVQQGQVAQTVAVDLGANAQVVTLMTSAITNGGCHLAVPFPAIQ